MPTYDYRCRACGHEFELYQTMSEGIKRKCPECTELKLERLIGGGAGILFRGSGFYETDYRSKSYKDAAAKDKPSESSSKETKKKDSKSSGSGDSGSKPSGSKGSTSGSGDKKAG